MSNNIPTTYSFPKEIAREYQQLTQSKWDFLEKLSPAERAKLIILYERLQNAWNRNTTVELSRNLYASSQELTQIQNEIASDWNRYEANTEEMLKRDIANRSLRLRKAKDNSTSSLESRKKRLQLKSENWNQDILKRETTLKQDEARLSSLSGSLATLNEQKQKLHHLKSELQEKSSIWNEESNFSSRIEGELQIDLSALEVRNKHDLQNDEKELEQQKKITQEILKKEREHLQQNLNQFEKKLLKQLRSEIAAELPNCPTELKEYLLQGELLLISMKHKSLIREAEQLTTALETALTKAGLNPEKYFEKVKLYMMRKDA